MVTDKFQRLKDSLHWQGRWTTFVLAVKIALRPLIEINRFLFFETDLTLPLAQVMARIPIEMREMAEEDIERFAALLCARGLKPDEFRRRLARGDRGLLAFSGAELTAFHWLGLSSQWLPEIGITLRLAPGEVYGYDAVTFPAWRGNRIHAALSIYVNQYAKTHGYARYLTYVRADNPRSLRTIAGRLRRRQTKVIWSIRVLGTQRPILLFGANGAGSPSFDLHATDEDASVRGINGIVRQPIAASELGSGNWSGDHPKTG